MQQQRIVARLLIRIQEQCGIQVTVNPSLPRIQRKQFERLLPVNEERLIPVKNMTEWICRYLWILCHTN